MLIYLTPRFYTCELSGSNVELVDLQIPELQLFLRGKDLSTRLPHPNQRYVVGGGNVRCPQVHQGAIPAGAQPRMQLAHDPEETGIVADHTPEGLIAERAEIFAVPTIERARLLSGGVVGGRIPSVESAFRAG